jgi:ribonucleoside-diphosphate reductase beta chain
MTYEPILHDDERVSLYPLQRQDIWELYQNHKSTFWTAEEIDLSDDLNDWKKLTKQEKYFIEMTLGFFAASDLIVNEHLSHDFIEKITLLELQIYYRFQAMMEDIHSNTYADMINAYVNDENRKDELFNSVKRIPCVQKKGQWAQKHIHSVENDEVKRWVTRLVVFAAVEGIFFSGSFCSIFWLKKRGLMPGLTFSNELISRDEGLHRDVACYVYKHLIQNKLEEEEVIAIISEAVDMEKEFVTKSLPVDIIGMNSRLMCQYIEYVADHLLVNLIGRRVYNVKNPFDWMVLISMQGKTNFFEKRVSEYSRAEVSEIRFDLPF